MGYWKNRAIEQGEAGFSYEGFEDVCSDCVQDAWLANNILTVGHVGACDFCEQVDVKVVPVEDLFVHMSLCIRREYCPESMSMNIPGREWGITAPSISSADLLEHYGAPLGEGDVHDRFIGAFEDDWIAEGVWSGDAGDILSQGWDRFVEEVKTVSRFVFLRRLDEELRTGIPGYDIEPRDMLDRLLEVLDECGLVIPFPIGQSVVRGRKHHPSVALTDSKALGAPPPHRACGQRMSPPGISFFYSACDEATALAELSGVDGEVATTADWLTQRDCFIVDLARIPPPPSIFDEVQSHMRPTIRFLGRFVQEISRPVRARDDPAVDYVPTQVVAEYIRHCVKSDGGEPIEGMKYPSAAKPGGTNVVLFPRPDDGTGQPKLLARQGSPRCHECVSTSAVWESRP